MQDEPTTITYATIEDILKEAGFYHIQQAEKLTGAINGSNKTFLTTYKPLYNTDSAVVTVNGVVAEISEINADTGVVTLVSAPPLGAEVLADYYYSAVDADFVRKCRAAVQCYINSFMDGYDPCAPYDGNVNLIPDPPRDRDSVLVSRDGGLVWEYAEGDDA